MEEHSISTEKDLMPFGFQPMAQILGIMMLLQRLTWTMICINTPRKGRLNGFKHALDLNIVTTLKDPNEVYQRLLQFLKNSSLPIRHPFVKEVAFSFSFPTSFCPKKWYNVSISFFGGIYDFLIARIIKGMIIALGFILPGVSGGVLAAILGIYERIIRFLAHIRENFVENILFFIPVGIGGILGIALFLPS